MPLLFLHHQVDMVAEEHNSNPLASQGHEELIVGPASNQTIADVGKVNAAAGGDREIRKRGMREML